MEEFRNAGDKLFTRGPILGQVNSPGDIHHFTIMAPETVSGATEEVIEAAQWVVLCMNSGLHGSTIFPSITVTDSSGHILEHQSATPDAVPNLNIENIIITPGETLTIAVDPGADTMAGPDEWYTLGAYIASFPVSSYEDGGYNCP